MFQLKFNHYLSNFTDEIIKNLTRKFISLKKLSEKQVLTKKDVVKNIECGFKSAFYMHFRYLSNNKADANLTDAQCAAIYLFIREMCYSSMFRFNRDGAFNVPYGGISYNGRTFDEKIIQYKNQNFIEKLQKTDIQCNDFEAFLNSYKIHKNDFIFLDPPYDSNFSCYDKNAFGKDDQKRLANYLIKKCQGFFMLVIKNTDFISSLYPEGKKCRNGQNLKINKVLKNYKVSFKNRNDRNTEHLFITNY